MKAEDVEREEGGVQDEAHTEPEGATKNPDVGHPVPGEGAGLPEEGPGRAAAESTPPIGTEDQGDQTEP